MFDPERRTESLNDHGLRRNGQSGFYGKRMWRHFDEQEGYPDGMCLDGRGRLWVAFWDGGAIRAFDPEEAIGVNPIAEFQLPVQRPTKIAFTGEGDCFVSSTSIGLENRIVNGLDDGRLLRPKARMFEL